MLSRYRIRVPDALSITPMPAASLRPRQPVRLRLRPLERADTPAIRVA
jgi:hypothetical protein